MHNVFIEDPQKKSFIIKSLPESLSVTSNVSSAHSDMNIEGLDALIPAELDRST